MWMTLEKTQPFVYLWVTKMAKNTLLSASKMADAVAELVEEYGDDVWKAMQNGLLAGANVLKEQLKIEAPESPLDTSGKKFYQSFTVKQYPNSVYVGNTKEVSDKNGKKVSLINILEYSTTRAHPFVDNAVAKSEDAVQDAVIAKIEKELSK